LKNSNYSDWSKEDLVKEIKKLKKRKKYGIVWDEEKTKEKFDKDSEEKLPILKKIKSKEIQTNGNYPTNILIEGDNYHALSVLNYTHAKQVDVIYIDPPYNTGSDDFKYTDNFSSGLIGLEDTYRHSKWLSFMKKRLVLARKLLKNSGVIFISIDDNEQAPLKILCDEIFGEKNFVNTISVKMSEPTGVKMSHVGQRLPKLKEYVLFYKKSTVQIQPPMIPKEKWDSEYNRLVSGVSRDELDELKSIMKKESTTSADIMLADKISSKIYLQKIDVLFNEAKATSESEKLRARYENAWRIVQIVSMEGTAKKIADTKRTTTVSKFFIIITPKKKKYLIKSNYDKKSGIPRIKVLFADDYLTTNAGDFWSDIKTTGLDNEGGIDFKNGKKPLKLIKRILQIASDKNDIILDFFAGSGTTGQATLELNKEGEGNRKFILCTNNEGNICTDVCYPRIQKAIKGYSKQVKGLGGNLKYFKTDFVDAGPTDKNKKKLVEQCTEMLCLKEDCFDELKQTKTYSIFKNHEENYLGIIYDDDGIEPLKKQIKSLGKKFNVYVFSLDDSAREEEFEDVIDIVDLKPIPEVILNVYRRIFR